MVVALRRIMLYLSIYLCYCFILTRVNGLEEYCLFDVFQPRCSIDEIIVIEEAHFGRKTMGRCLSDEGLPSETFLADPKFLGCYVDVKNILDSQCFGKHQCSVPVAKIDVKTDCHKWTKLYLGAKYSCLRVIEENRQCRAVVSSEKQHLMKSQKVELNCGLKDRPWTIEAMPGQRINLNIVQLSSSETSDNNYIMINGDSKLCQTGAKILDPSNKRVAIICSGASKSDLKNTNFFESSSNIVEINFEPETKTSTFIISLQAVGCSDLIPPADAWLKRTENEATIGCYSTRLRWQLKCVGQRWIGVIGNCSHGNQILISDTSPGLLENSPENSVVTIVGIAMVGFVMCFLIICIGVVFLNRYYALSKSRAMKQISLYNGDQTFRDTNGCQIDLENQSFVNGFDHGTNMKYNFHGSKMKEDIETNQKYYELDHSLVKNEIFLK